MSLKSLLDTSWQPNHRQLFAIVANIAAGLHQIKLVKGRGHGNLKLSNVLIHADHRNFFGAYTSRRWNVFLTDFRWESHEGSPAEHSADLRSLGKLLYEIVVIGRPLRGEQGERFSKAGLGETEPWQRLDARKGDAWREMCASLGDAIANKSTVEDLLAAIEKLDPELEVPWKKSGTFPKRLSAGIVAGVVLTGVGSALVYRQAPIIFGQPVESYLQSKQLRRYTVNTISLASQRYQWLTNGSAVSGATNREYFVGRELVIPEKLQLAVVVQNYFGSTTSRLVTLERRPDANVVKRPPTITFVSNPIRVVEGEDVLLRAAVVSDSPGRLQWRGDTGRILREEAIHSQVEHELKLRDVKKQTHDRRIYSLVASNEGGNITQNLTLLVTLKTPVISANTNGQSDEVVLGQECVLRVEDRSDTYAWYRDFKQEISAGSSPIQHGAEFRFRPQSTNESGWIAVVASNEDSSTTNWFRRRFVELPSLDQFATVQSVTLEPGKPHQLPKVTAGGSEPISLQWFKDDVLLGVTTNRSSWSLSPQSGRSLAGLYRVEATNPWGKINRDIARIATKQATQSQPLKVETVLNLVQTMTPNGQRGAYFPLGEPAVLTFTANRSDASYEWLRNGVRLEVSGPTNRINTITTSDAGNYELRVAAGGEAFTNKFYLWVQVTNAIGMELVWIPGVPGMKNGAWVGRHEVSQSEFFTLMKVNPSSIRRTNDTDLRDYPVERVSWQRATDFVATLTRTMPLPFPGEYRLPTEAQFRHVVGEMNRTQVVSAETSRGRLESRNSRPPNAFGLHHILGNISEIVYVHPGTNLWSIGGGFRVPLRTGPVKFDENHKESFGSASADLGMRVFYGEAVP